MRTNLHLGTKLPSESYDDFIRRTLRTLEEASLEDAMIIADAYTVFRSQPDPSRSLDANNATVQQVANVLCSFIEDLQKRSINRAE